MTIRKKPVAVKFDGTGRDVLLAALCFVDKASGTALAIAMAGSNHPNPDEVLTDLAKEGMTLSSSIRATINCRAKAST